MILSLVILLILLVLSIIYIYNSYTETFVDKKSEYIINVFPNIVNSNPSKYISYYNNKSIIESDNNNCVWCYKKKYIKNIVKKNFNDQHNNVIIKPINGYRYEIILEGNSKIKYVFNKKSYNKYELLNDNKVIYLIYENTINNRKVITIRDNKFNEQARFTFNSKVKDNHKGFNDLGDKYTYQLLNENFKNNMLLGYSVFEIINEINRDKFK